MATFQIPNSQGQIRQVNRGDTYGELSSSFNVDLASMAGKIKASKKLGRILSDDDLGGEIPQDLLVHDGRYYFLTDDNVYICDVTDDPTVSSNWGVLTPSIVGDSFSGIGLESTLVSYNGKVLISGATDINEFNPSSGVNTDDWWSDTTSDTLTANRTHTMHVHRGGQETLIVADGNEIKYYNSTAGLSAITLDPLFVVHCFASGVNSVWAGTYTETGENAYVYEFFIGEQLDGAPVARNAYRVDGRAVLAIEVVNNVPYVVTEKGYIQEFNAAGFVTPDQLTCSFPFAQGNTYLDGVRTGLVQQSASARPIHPRGMKADGDHLYIFLNSKREGAGDPVDARTPSGIWDFNTLTNILTHRAAVAAGDDCGQSNLINSGPLLIANHPETRFLVGTRTTDGDYGLFGDSTDTPCGYIETAEFVSGNTQDSYNTIVVSADTLEDGERIMVKYKERNIRDFPLVHDMNWIDATTFTTTESIEGAEEGDEVFISEGYGAGKAAHIESITESTNTYTVTLDESIGAEGETGRGRIDRWKKVPVEYTRADGEYKSFGIPVTNTWMKAKVAWEGDVTIRKVIIKSEAKT